MKAINLENLKRLKKALQKQKLKRIDSLRMQVGRCDQNPNDIGVEIVQGVIQLLYKDASGQLNIVAPDLRSSKPFQLLSNTAETVIEMTTGVQKPD